MKNQSELQEITSNLLETREKSCVKDPIGFSFTLLWLEKLTRDFEANHQGWQSQSILITFDSHLKTALIEVFLVFSDVKAVMFDILKH